MSFQADCPGCMAGQHDKHKEDWGIVPGLIGGTSCDCTGDCAKRLALTQDAFTKAWEERGTSKAVTMANNPPEGEPEYRVYTKDTVIASGAAGTGKKTVPLVVYKGGERIVVGEAEVDLETWESTATVKSSDEMPDDAELHEIVGYSGYYTWKHRLKKATDDPR